MVPRPMLGKPEVRLPRWSNRRKRRQAGSRGTCCTTSALPVLCPPLARRRAPVPTLQSFVILTFFKRIRPLSSVKKKKKNPTLFLLFSVFKFWSLSFVSCVLLPQHSRILILSTPNSCKTPFKSYQILFTAEIGTLRSFLGQLCCLICTNVLIIPPPPNYFLKFNSIILNTTLQRLKKKKCNRAMEAEMLELAFFFLSLIGMAFLNTNSCQTLNSLYPGMNVLIKSYLISLAPWNSA